MSLALFALPCLICAALALEARLDSRRRVRVTSRR
jgi:hypothetical protein